MRRMQESDSHGDLMANRRPSGSRATRAYKRSSDLCIKTLKDPKLTLDSGSEKASAELTPTWLLSKVLNLFYPTQYRPFAKLLNQEASHPPSPQPPSSSADAAGASVRVTAPCFPALQTTAPQIPMLRRSDGQATRAGCRGGALRTFPLQVCSRPGRMLCYNL
ncbi:hypothetical protein E4U36_006670 [Claviceps purpurea]|nr:hypothetical protein E4U36_006670 [Claviceps purpurea]